MLHYTIHGFLITELTVGKAFKSYAFHWSIERVVMETQHFTEI